MTEEKRSPEEILDVNRRWLPPSPHVEKVVEMVQNDRAYIQRRGHNEPPLLMCEDGGVIELPKVRYEETYRGMQVVSADDAGEGVTRFTDVCGCVDHIKGVLQDDPESAQANPHIFDQLLDHALYMIDRMYKREAEYAQFAAEVITACTKLPHAPDPAMATNAASEIKHLLHSHPQDAAKYTELLNSLAEDVRYVASYQEECLREYKELALKLHGLYERVKGARRWEE